MKRNTLWKKLIALGLAAGMVLALGACGNSTVETEVTADEPAQEGTTETPAESAAGEKVKISFWTPFSGGDADIMTSIVDEFNAQSTTTEVEFVVFKSEEYYTKLLAAITSDTAPTVAISHATRVKEYMTDGLIEPIEDLAATANVDWTEFTDPLQEVSQIDGVHYCVPLDTHLLLLHINKAEFEKLGLLEADGTVQLPRGEEELFNYFHSIKDQLEGGKMVLSGTSANGLPFYLWYTLLTQYGGDVCDEAGTTATLDSEENKKALSVMMRLVEEEIWPKNQKNGAELFTGNVAVATINGDWGVPIFEATEGLDFISIPFPQFTDKDSVYADSHTMVLPVNINKTDAERQSAIEFMAWMADHTDQWAKAGHIPSKTAIIESDAFKALPYRSEYAQSANYAKTLPKVCGVAGLTDMAYRELAAMVAGEQDVETTAAHMQKEFQEILDSYK